MAEDEKPGLFHAIGAALLAVVGGAASFADDCARAGGHLAGSTDDLARIGAHADDLAGSAVHAAPDLPVDLALDLADLGLNGYDLLSSAPQAAPPSAAGAAQTPRPHLVVAGAANPPADGPVDPLVLLVRDADPARIQRLTEGCTALDHRCVVIACPPAIEACVAGWQATWAELSTEPALVGHPEALVGALAGSVHVRAQAGSWLYDGVATPTGVTVGKRAIR